MRDNTRGIVHRLRIAQLVLESQDARSANYRGFKNDRLGRQPLRERGIVRGTLPNVTLNRGDGDRMRQVKTDPSSDAEENKQDQGGNKASGIRTRVHRLPRY